jgi:MFS family permease
MDCDAMFAVYAPNIAHQLLRNIRCESRMGRMSGDLTRPDATSIGLWRNRDYMLLLTGQTVSKMGSGMSIFVFPLVAYASTRSLVIAGAVGSTYAIGNAAMLLPAGVRADRHDRRRIMVGSALVGAVLFASLVCAHEFWRLTSVHLLVVALLAGAATAQYSPAETAAIRMVVPTEQIATAVATNQGRQMLSNLVAAPLGGALLSLGRVVPFAVDSASYLIAAVAASAVRTPLAPEQSASQTKPLAAMREGIRWLWTRRGMRQILLGGTVLNFALSALLLAIALVLQKRGLPYAAIGLLETAAAIAGIIGAVAAPRLVATFRTGTLSIVATWVVAIALTGLCLVTSYAGLLALLVAAFLAAPAINAALMGYQIAVTPTQLQGRVSASSTFIATCAQPLGPLLAGLLLDSLPRALALGGFGAVVIITAVVMTFSASIRSIPRPKDWQNAST